MSRNESSQTVILEPEDVIAETLFFAGLDEAQLRRVAALCTTKHFPQDSPIYELGEPAEEFYILVEGVVRFTIGFGPMRASAGEVIRRGDVFGWAALLDGAPTRLATAYCLTPCQVLAMDGSELLELMEQDHTMGYPLMRALNTLIVGKLTTFAAG